MDNIVGTSYTLAILREFSDICSISLYIASLDLFLGEAEKMGQLHKIIEYTA